jgi:signal transduction histidine kinase
MSSTGHLSEVESLRSLIADLTRALAGRDQSTRAQSHHLEEPMRDLREQSHLLRTTIEGTAAETGDEFFASLVTHLTSTLPLQYVVIGEVLEGRLRMFRTCAVSAGGTLVDNFEYELAHTPCATALTQTFAYFDRDVRATFPQFQCSGDLRAESYCAVPLRTKGEAVIGLLVVMDTKPLRHGEYLHFLLGVLAPRVVVEFERRRAAQALSSEQSSLLLRRNIQEAVSNCIRHGRAQEARVSLKMLKQGVRLSIRDNGREFTPDVSKGTGHGLANMAARAQKIGGRLTVLSKMNEETRIVFDLPNEASYARR